MFVLNEAACAALTRGAAKIEVALMLRLWALATQYDTAILAERVPSKAKPGDRRSRNGEVSLETEAKKGPATVDGLFSMCDLSRMLQHPGQTKLLLPLRSFMSAEADMPQKAKMTDEHTKHVPMRASLHQAVEEQKGLRALARSPKAGDNQKALEKLKDIRNPASPNAVLGTDWDHSNARHWIWNADAEGGASAYDEEQPLRAPAVCAAKFPVLRSSDQSLMEEYLYEVLIAADIQLAGWWRGRQLGLISFLASAAEFHGSMFDKTFATQKNWDYCTRSFFEQAGASC